MSELQETIKLLRDMKPMFDPGEDYMTVAAAEEHVNHLAAQRQKEIDDHHASLKALAKQLDAARASATRPPTVASEEAHARTLNELDALRISYAKAFNDTESMQASKEAELVRLKDERSKLEASDSGAEHDLDGTALRLAMFRGLGFEPVCDKDGVVHKMLIRSSSGEIYTVTFDHSKTNEGYAQVLWRLASS